MRIGSPIGPACDHDAQARGTLVHATVSTVTTMTTAEDALERVVVRVRELAASYEPPDFGHVPDPDAAIFLCAVDHRTGYRDAHIVDGEGPLAGSELMWAVALAAARRRPGLLRAGALAEVSGAEVAEVFAIEGRDGRRSRAPGRALARPRSRPAARLRGRGGSAPRRRRRRRLGGAGGLLERLARFTAYADPLAKKSQLLAKICARRGWFEVADPEHWQVCADNVLMRLALRSGLVAPGDDVDRVRAATRDAFAAVAAAAAIEPPLLDDLLWELGRDDPDLLGAEAGDLREPARAAGVVLVLSGWDDVAVAYDEDLADRIRELLAGDPEISEMRMFGGIAFLVGGNMSVGASSQGGLMVRVDPEQTDALVAEPHARPFEMRGRPMRGWLRVDTEGVRTEEQLRRWVERGVACARTLPAKH